MSKLELELIPILSNKSLSLMVQQNTKNLIVDETGNASIAEPDDSDGFVITITAYDQKGISTQAYQLLDALIATYTKYRPDDLKIHLDVATFVEMRGITPQTIYKDIPGQLRELEKLGYNCAVKRGGKRKDIGFIKLCGGTGILKDGYIIFNINQDFRNALEHMDVRDYNAKALKVDARINPHTYYLIKKIDWHYTINVGKTNQNAISIKTLMNACPYLPYEEEVAEAAIKSTKFTKLSKYPKFAERIMHPLLRDLSQANIDFTLTNKKKKVMLQCINGQYPKTRISYTEFRDGYVLFDFSNYPDHKEKVEKREAYFAEARAKRSKKVKK